MLSKRKNSSDGETRTRLDVSQDSRLRNKNFRDAEKFTSNRRTRSKSNDIHTSERQPEKMDTSKQRVNEETDRNKDYSSVRRSNNNEKETETAIEIVAIIMIVETIEIEAQEIEIDIMTIIETNVLTGLFF
jgi:hypothetical protein